MLCRAQDTAMQVQAQCSRQAEYVLAPAARHNVLVRLVVNK